MKKLKYVIVTSGMGGMLNPPKDAEHTHSVAIKYSNGRDAGSMSLRAALKDEDVPVSVRLRIKSILLTTLPEMTEEWEHSVYNYFRGCYSPDGIDRNVSNVVIDKTNSRPADHHLAVMLIRSFFPDYTPNLELIENNGNKGSWSKGD
jgi:hypothetical protein